jgi:hypothetical protein
MGDWNEKASVRAGERRVFVDSDQHCFFSRESVPFLEHEMLKDCGPEIEKIILVQKLFGYLHFTEALERRVVVPSCTSIAEKDLPFSVPKLLMRDASKIIVDEAHHAECSSDLVEQISRVTKITPCILGKPLFLTTLEKRLSEFPAPYRRLAKMVFATVSETIITKNLAKVARDEMIIPAVREVILDHARDESRHHACFASFVGIMWDQLKSRERDFAGPLFGEFIEIYLYPDFRLEVAWLTSAGYPKKRAKKIIDDTYEKFDFGVVLSDAAKATIRILGKYGILDSASVVDSLGQRGIV